MKRVGQAGRVAWAIGGVLSAVVSVSQPVFADEPAQPTTAPADDPQTAKARSEFNHGVELVKAAQWAEALAAFEQSKKDRPHPVTTFNIGACQQAMGRYTAARLTFARALSESSDAARLPDDLTSDAKARVSAIDRLVAHVLVHVKPSEVRIAVDGRPLHALSGGKNHYAAGIDPPGAGTMLHVPSFELEVDPGNRLIVLTRPGYSDAVVNKTFDPGTRTQLDLDLDRLPASVDVRANIPGALVELDGADLGPVPVEVKRPAGSYKLKVRKDGFEPIESVLRVNPGQRAEFEAKLTPEKVGLTGHWWFWAGAAAVVAGGAVLTYALTRPEPQPPPYETGNTGWLAQPSAARF